MSESIDPNTCVPSFETEKIKELIKLYPYLEEDIQNLDAAGHDFDVVSPLKIVDYGEEQNRGRTYLNPNDTKGEHIWNYSEDGVLLEDPPENRFDLLN